MQDHYPSQEFGPDTVKGYLFDFERLAVKHGLSRFERVMLDFRIRPGQRFFPHPSEVAEALESLVHREREEERLRATKFVRAVACQCSAHTDGYVIVAYAPGRPSGAYRCECWKDWKRDKDQNGGD